MNGRASSGLFDARSPLPPDPRQWRICLVLPTRNESATLEEVTLRIREVFRKHALQPPILLIADDSHDGTRQIAHRLGVHVVIGGGGLGVAMARGLRAALAFRPDLIMSADADGQSDMEEVMRFLEPIAQDRADLVIGSRFLEKGLIKYGYKPVNRLGMFILSRILRRITGLSLTDSHGGLRAMRPEVVRALDIIGTHTYVQETIIDAYEKGYRIVEVPSVWHPRKRGKSQVVGSVSKYIMYTLPVLIIRAGVHIRWSYTAAFILITVALSYFLSVVWQAGGRIDRMFPRLPAFVFISMMILMSIQLFTLGFLMELMGGIKLRVDRLSSERSEERPEELEGVLSGKG